MTSGHRLVSGFFGPLSGPIQTMPWAGLLAIISAMRVAIKPVRIHTDHTNIIKGIDKGKHVTRSAGHQNADLWTAFWSLVEDLGGMDDQLQIVWVKARINDGSVESIGNNWADALAKASVILRICVADTLNC